MDGDRDMKKVILCALCVMVSFPALSASDSISSAENYIKQKMKDPDSTKFQNVRSINNSQGASYICGEANAKNSYGGYVGFKPFAYKEGRVVLDGSYDKPEDMEFFASSGCGGKDLEKMELANKQAKSGCKISWEQISDVVLFNQSPESAATNAITKIKLINPSINGDAEDSMKKQFIESINATVSNKEFVKGVKNNANESQAAFMKSCIDNTSKAIYRN